MSTNTKDSTKKFSKILVAIDGSEPSMDAADLQVLLDKTLLVQIVKLVQP